MSEAHWWRAAGLATTLSLAGCWTSETAILTAENSIQVSGVQEGRYCHVENKLEPPQVAVTFAISESLGENRCRDLHFDPATGRYIDKLSAATDFRIGELNMPLQLLQMRTSATAVARYSPIVVVDGMFMQFDPAGVWPAGLVEASGLALNEEGELIASEPDEIRKLLQQAFAIALEQMRDEVAYVEDTEGPRLEFSSIDKAYSYIVYVREDWNGNTEAMRDAMLAMADKLSLRKLDQGSRAN